MASEILVVPEDHLDEVIKVIRAGLKAVPNVTPEVKYQLKKWCNEEEAYLHPKAKTKK